MTNTLSLPLQTALDDSGAASSGAKLYFYTTGTSTPKDTYSEATLTSANTNPVVADSAGRFGIIYLGDGNYKVVLKTSADATVWTADPVSNIGTILATGSTTSRSLQTRFAEKYNVLDWGAKGDGTTNDTAAIQAAIDQANSDFSGTTNRSVVYMPPGLEYLISTAITVKTGVRLEFPSAKITSGVRPAIKMQSRSALCGDNSLLRATGGVAGGFVAADGSASVSSVALEGFYLTHASNKYAGSIGIDMDRAIQWELLNVEVDGAVTGILLDGGTNNCYYNVLDHVAITDTTTALQLKDNSNGNSFYSLRINACVTGILCKEGGTTETTSLNSFYHPVIESVDDPGHAIRLYNAARTTIVAPVMSGDAGITTVGLLIEGTSTGANYVSGPVWEGGFAASNRRLTSPAYGNLTLVSALESFFGISTAITAVGSGTSTGNINIENKVISKGASFETSLGGGMILSAINTSTAGDAAIFKSARTSGGALMILDRTAADGTEVSIRQGGVEEGNIDVTGAVVGYNTFTGGHWAQWASEPQDDPPVGTLVSTVDQAFERQVAEWTEKQMVKQENGPPVLADVKVVKHRKGQDDLPPKAVVRDAPKPQLCKIEVTASQADSRVYGVFAGRNANDDLNTHGIGTAMVRVTGPVEGGDLLQSSATPGIAEKQPDDLVRSYTVGKVSKSDASPEEKLVACVLYCG